MPNPAYGSRADLVYGEETTWGTAPAASIYYEHQSENLGSPADPQISAQLPRDRKVTDAKRGRRKAGGSVVSELMLKSHGTILKHALGSNNTTGVGPYTHTITPAVSLPPGLSLEKWLSDLDTPGGVRYLGCRINRLHLSFPASGPVILTADYLAKSSAKVTSRMAATPTNIRGIKLNELEITCKLNDVLFGYLISGEVEILNNLDADGFALGTEARVAMGAGLRAVTAKLSIFVTDFARYDAWVNGTVEKLELIATQGANSLTVRTPKSIITGDADPQISGPDRIARDLSVNAYGDASNNDVEMVLVNDLATI